MRHPTGFRCILASLLLAVSICRGGEVPDLFRRHDFNAATLAQAVNHYISLGPRFAVWELSELTALSDLKDEQLQQAFKRLGIGRDVDVPERIGWICRILYQGRPLIPLRPPAYGGHMLPYETMPKENWPLYPVAASGRSYFVLAEGYNLAGRPEHPRDYLAYCGAFGIFRTTPIAIPTRAQALEDIRALRESSAWTVIKWTDHSTKRGQSWSYVMDPIATWHFLKAQAESIE